MYDATFESSWTSLYQKLCASSDSADFYPAAYYMDSLAMMTEATGQQRYVDRGFSCIRSMMATARPSRDLPGEYEDNFRGWVSNQHGQHNNETPLYESYMWRYVAKFLRVLHQNPSLLAANRDAYAATLRFTENDMFTKWWSRGEGNIYRSNVHMASHWAHICLDLKTLTANATIRSQCSTIVATIDRDIRRQLTMQPHERAFVWGSNWGETQPVQDVSHANGFIAYAVEAHHLGSPAWTLADMRTLAATWETLWKADGNCPVLVDGSGTDRCWFSDGWSKLGEFDGDLQARLETHNVGRGPQLYAAGALNAAKLGLR